MRGARGASDSPAEPTGALLATRTSQFAIFQTWSYARSHESTDNAQVDGRIVPVYAKVGGYVRAVSVAENDRVTEGAVVVQIDDAEYRVRLAQAEADLAAAQATAGVRGGAAGQAAEVQTAASQQSATSAQIEAAQANLTALQRQSEAAGSTVTSARAGVRLAEARLAAAQAARENAALQLGYTRVVAPASGTVARKQVVDAYDGCAAEGRVASVGPATGAKFALLSPDNATGNFTKVVQRVPIRINLVRGCGSDRPLRPGMSVSRSRRGSRRTSGASAT